MIDGRVVILGALLSLAGSARYARQTVRGRIRPNRVTWFFCAAAPLIGFLAQLAGGVGLPLIMTLSVGVGLASVIVLIAWRGSHVVVRCLGGCQTVVPAHRGADIATGTLRAIERALTPCLGERWLG